MAKCSHNYFYTRTKQNGTTKGDVVYTLFVERLIVIASVSVVIGAIYMIRRRIFSLCGYRKWQNFRSTKKEIGVE